jgi:Phosphopantetheinyl transferase
MRFSQESQLVVRHGEVHVWRTDLNLLPPRIDALRSLLTEEELTRAERLRFEHHRRRFVVARATLRLLLSQYLRVAPEQVAFEYLADGKPCLHANHGIKPIEFNLSHAEECAVYAFAVERALGIDIEYLTHPVDYQPVARRFFSPGEVQALKCVPEALRKRAFFECWTRKEAFVKATGKGLAQSFDQFEVSVAPGEPARLLNVKSFPQEAQRWSMYTLDVGPDYVGALVVQGGWGLMLSFRDYSGEFVDYTH